MTLKEQLLEWHDSPTNETVDENIIDLEAIAENFAIDFAEWLIESNGKPNGEFTIKQLLEIYKKENNL